jgi:hypothetical protein
VNVGAPLIRASVTFLPAGSGGRSSPPCAGPSYRPHLVVGDPPARVAGVAADGRTLTESYLGVRLCGDDKDHLPLGLVHAIGLELIYAPDVDYSALVPGVTFTIREGHVVVGYGHVLEEIK